jgi:hypothetical protein
MARARIPGTGMFFSSGTWQRDKRDKLKQLQKRDETRRIWNIATEKNHRVVRIQ